MPAIDSSEMTDRFEAALESQRASLLAMPETQLQRHTRLDPSAAAHIAYASAERVGAHREALVALCGPRAIPFVDALPELALATRQADIEFLRQEEPDDLGPLHERVHAAHRLLLADAETLVNRGLVPASEIDNARGIQGYQATLNSLQVLISMFRARWRSIEGRSPTTRGDLETAQQAAFEMNAALARRTPGLTSVTASELRVRALSKLIATYEEVRRMTQYLRFYEEDADSIIPSFYAGRGGRKPTRTGDDDVIPPPPPTPTPVNGDDPFTP